MQCGKELNNIVLILTKGQEKAVDSQTAGCRKTGAGGPSLEEKEDNRSRHVQRPYLGL